MNRKKSEATLHVKKRKTRKGNRNSSMKGGALTERKVDSGKKYALRNSLPSLTASSRPIDTTDIISICHKRVAVTSLEKPMTQGTARTDSYST